MTDAMMPDTIEASADPFDDVLRSWAKSLPGVDLTSVSLSVRISRLAALFNRGIEELVRPHGFGFGELEVLFFLHSVGKPFEMRPSDLTRGCFVTSGAITGRVDRLAKLGFVTRIPSQIDRRETVVRMTPEGEKLTRRLQGIVARQSLLAIVLSEFPKHTRTELDASVRKLLTRLEEMNGLR